MNKVFHALACVIGFLIQGLIFKVLLGTTYAAALWLVTKLYLAILTTFLVVFGIILAFVTFGKVKTPKLKASLK